MKFQKTILVASLLALAACGDAMTYPLEVNKEVAEAAATASTPVAEIEVSYSNTIAGGAYTVVGPVEATVGKLTAFHPTPTVEFAEQKLQIEAAELGADAIINATVSDATICGLSWGCRKASGTAVAFAN